MTLFGGLPVMRESSAPTSVGRALARGLRRKGPRLSGANGSLSELGTLFFFSVAGHLVVVGRLRPPRVSGPIGPPTSTPRCRGGPVGPSGPHFDAFASRGPGDPGWLTKSPHYTCLPGRGGRGVPLPPGALAQCG